MPGKWHNKMEELFPQEMGEVKFSSFDKTLSFMEEVNDKIESL